MNMIRLQFFIVCNTYLHFVLCGVIISYYKKVLYVIKFKKNVQEITGIFWYIVFLFGCGDAVVAITALFFV